MLEESFRDGVDARLKTFWADALRKAGGTDRLAERLAELGILGRDGRPYNRKSIEAWRGGRRQPGADVLLVVALDFHISIDRYLFTEAQPDPDALAAKVAELERFQDLILTWAYSDERFVETIRTRAPELERRVAG